MDWEYWKPVTGYEGLYQINENGEVASLNYQGRGYRKLLKPVHIGKYLRVQLWKNGIGRYFFVHRLVAKAFIPNPLNFPIINHKDENPENNKATNLEWCSYKYNSNYGTCKKKLSQYRTGQKNGNGSKTVLQYDKRGKLLKEWPSSYEVKRQLGFDPSHITECCLGKRKTHMGFVWKYKI